MRHRSQSPSSPTGSPSRSHSPAPHSPRPSLTEQQYKEKSEGELERLLLLQVLSGAFIVAHGLPVLFRSEILPTFIPALTFHDLIDFLVLPCQITAFLLLYLALTPRGALRFSHVIPFCAAAVLMANGHGIHLAANAINRPLADVCASSKINPAAHYASRQQIPPEKVGDGEMPVGQALLESYQSEEALPRACRLAYILDEHIGHHFWFAGFLVCFYLLLWVEREMHDYQGSSVFPKRFLRGLLNLRPLCGVLSVKVMVALSLAGSAVLHGAVWFGMCVEGQTVVLLGYAASIPFVISLFLPTKKRSMVVHYYFGGAHLVALGGLMAWGWHFGGYPELSVLELGHFHEWPGVLLAKILGFF